jgi:transcriptional regulator with XRE-family HTH domain
MADSDVSREIAQRVREAIDRQGTTQVAIARQLGWPQQRFARRLTSAEYAAPFTAAELTEVARVLGVPLSTLLPDETPAQVTA